MMLSKIFINYSSDSIESKVDIQSPLAPRLAVTIYRKLEKAVCYLTYVIASNSNITIGPKFRSPSYITCFPKKIAR